MSSVQLEQLALVEQQHLIRVCVFLLSCKNTDSFPLKAHRLDKDEYVELVRPLLLVPDSTVAAILLFDVLPDVLKFISTTLARINPLRVASQYGLGQWKLAVPGVKTKDYYDVYFSNVLGNDIATLTLYRPTRDMGKDIPGDGSFFGLLAFAPSHH
jgi:hypothetical protein